MFDYQWVPVGTRDFDKRLSTLTMQVHSIARWPGGQAQLHQILASATFFLNGNHADCRMLGFTVELLWELDGISEPVCGSIFALRL